MSDIIDSLIDALTALKRRIDSNDKFLFHRAFCELHFVTCLILFLSSFSPELLRMLEQGLLPTYRALAFMPFIIAVICAWLKHRSGDDSITQFLALCAATHVMLALILTAAAIALFVTSGKFNGNDVYAASRSIGTASGYTLAAVAAHVIHRFKIEHAEE